MAKVFVSYSRKDSRKVKHILGVLKNHGFEFWQDINSIGNGKYWPEEIARGIVNCSRFLLLMSTSSVSSDNVRDEVQIAYEKKKKKVILRLDDSKLPLMLTTQLIGIQRTDYSSDHWEAEIVSALGGGKKFFQQPKPSPAQPAKPSQQVRPLPKKAPKAQPVIDGLLRAFSGNGRYHTDQCDALLSKLDDLAIVAASHWVNPSLAFKELVPRQFLLDKIEVIRSLIQDFRETCPPGSSTKRQLILDELKLLSQELARKTNP